MGGGIFDFNGDGELDFGEAMVAAGILGTFIDEEERASKKADREDDFWGDDDDDWESDEDDW